MNTNYLRNLNPAYLFIMALFVNMGSPITVLADPGAPPVNIAKLPLNATITTAPNVLYILDDSGSMDRDYLPDWAALGYCRTANGTNFAQACSGSSTINSLPPFRSSDFNSIYYNPAIRYTAPKNADGTSKPDQTTWTSVKDDAYGIQTTASTNLVTSYTDTEWCTSSAYTDCLRNDNYILPATVNGKNYTTVHKVSATGSGFIATGPRNAPTTTARSFGPHYYVINAGEYCDSTSLTKCQETEDSTYAYPAKIRWCDTESNAVKPPPAVGAVSNCQATRTSSRTVARYPTKYLKTTSGSTTITNQVLYVPGTAQVGTPYIPAVPAKPAVGASVTFSLILGSNCEGSNKARISELRVNGTNILLNATNKTLDASTLAGDVRSLENSASYVASGSGSSIKLQALPAAGNIAYPVTLVLASGSCTVTMSPASPKFSGYTAATDAVAAIPESGNYQQAQAATCSNPITLSGLSGPNAWGFTNGQKVCQTSTTGASTTQYYGSFSRVDITTGNTYTKSLARTDCTGLSCSYTEEMTNFANWWTYYRTRMQAMKTSTSLAFDAVGDGTRVGFSTISDTAATNGTTFLNINNFSSGHKSLWYSVLFNSKPEGDTPLREALSQAGRLYANKIGTSDPVQYSCQKNYALLTTDGYWNGDNPSGAGGQTLSGATMTNLDSGTTVPRPKREGATAAGTLADVAKYYFDTDLRTSALGNCSGSFGSSVNVCEDGTSSVIQKMSTFTLGLGVDGTLKYTKDYATSSVGDYADIVTGIKTWPSPFAGDDEKIDDLWHAAVNGEGAYFSAKNPNDVIDGLADALASIGSSKQAGAASGLSSSTPVEGNNFVYRPSFTTDQWTGNVEKRTIDPSTGGFSNTIFNCVEDVDAEAPLSSCTGINTTSPKVAAITDSRNIYINSGGVLASFTYTNLPVDLKDYFKAGYLSTHLSQWSVLTTAQQLVAKEDGIVNYLRGQTGLEDRSANVNGSTDTRLFRFRKATLGDVVGSEPVYVAAPTQDYADPGYAAFKASKSGRSPTVYVGANDGMLHAFRADTLEERWAYVPSAVIPKMWYLADRNYQHENYINGSVSVTDAYINGAWKTILVGGLDGGGRGYYALDITDPVSPQLLWEFTEANMGYTFGRPKIVKTLAGKWVVLLTSGYNNRPDSLKSTGNGLGYLYVVDAADGSIINTYSTGEGSADLPSGLAKVSAYVDDSLVNRTASFVYGGDLAGNLWRFNINNPPVAGTNPLLFAKLKDGSGVVQAITTAPELGEIDKKRMVFVGTGKYLEVDDRSTTQTQTLYGIQDNDVSTTLTNPRSSLVQQTYTGSGTTRTSTNQTVDYSVVRGWYVDLPDSGERQNIDSRLLSGNLVVLTNVPTGTGCNPSGYGWLNIINYRTGGATNTITNTVSSQQANGGVGLIGLSIEAGITAGVSGGNKDCVGTACVGGSLQTPSNPEFQGRRSIWRELTK